MVKEYFKTNSARFWAWVNTNWFTKSVFGVAFIIVVLRLSTTCIVIWEIEIGCEYYDDYDEPLEYPEPRRD